MSDDDELSTGWIVFIVSMVVYLLVFPVMIVTFALLNYILLWSLSMFGFVNIGWFNEMLYELDLIYKSFLFEGDNDTDMPVNSLMSIPFGQAKFIIARIERDD